MIKSNTKIIDPKNNANVFDWEFIKTDEGEPVSMIPFKFSSVQIDGEFNDDQVIHFEGSNDDTIFHEIKDANGNYIEVTEPCLFELPVSYSSIKPCFYSPNEEIESKINVKLFVKGALNG